MNTCKPQPGGSRAQRFEAKLSALKTHAAAALCIAASTLIATAENWPSWRGAGGSGICREKELPLSWSTNETVRWRVALPDRGNSTPIVWEKRVFIADVFVLRASPTFECLVTNSIGGEPMNASLAVSDGEIFIQTDKRLWCISATARR